MAAHSTLSCSYHEAMDCPDVLVVVSDQHGPGLPVRRSGGSFVTIRFCPWCGADLRDSGGPRRTARSARLTGFDQQQIERGVSVLRVIADGLELLTHERPGSKP